MQNQDKLSFPELEPDDINASQSDKERFKCSICWGIVCDPMFCSNLKCGKPFCKACLDEHREKNKKEECSLCKNNEKFREISYIEKDSIDNIKLRCKHFGCFQFIKYNKTLNFLNFKK